MLKQRKQLVDNTQRHVFAGAKVRKKIEEHQQKQEWLNRKQEQEKEEGSQQLDKKSRFGAS
jgi:hypothetical protein